jgi:hypothetical protein
LRGNGGFDQNQGRQCRRQSLDCDALMEAMGVSSAPKAARPGGLFVVVRLLVTYGLGSECLPVLGHGVKYVSLFCGFSGLS